MRSTMTTAVVAAAIAAVIAPRPSQAQSDYPNRVVKIVVPYAAGTVPDILVRALTPGLSSRLGQQFIVENKAGGSGALGTASVARAEAGRLHGVVRAGGGALGAAAGAQRYRLQARRRSADLSDLRQHDGARGAAGFADQDHRRPRDCSEAEARRAELRPSRRHDHPASRCGRVPAGRRDRHQGHPVPQRTADRSPSCLADGSMWCRS